MAIVFTVIAETIWILDFALKSNEAVCNGPRVICLCMLSYVTFSSAFAEWDKLVMTLNWVQWHNGDNL